MRTSESTKELVAALAAAQAEFPKLVKDSENPYYKSKYADLSSIINAVQDTLGKQGLAVTQHLESEFQAYFDSEGTMRGERVVLCLITRLEHSSGEFEESTLRVPLLDGKPQTLGSASTYVRRYALQSILRVAAEADDDGNASSLQENWGKQKRDQYVEEKRQKLQSEISEQAAKTKLKKELEASVEDLTEAKEMPPLRSQPKSQARDEELLTDAQRKMIWAIVQKRGLSDGELREMVGSLGYESLGELPKARVSALLEEIDPDHRYHSASTYGRGGQ